MVFVPLGRQSPSKLWGFPYQKNLIQEYERPLICAGARYSKC